MEGFEPSDGPRDVEFKMTYMAGGCIFEDKINVTVVHVEFVEDPDQKYGYDDYSEIDPWKSVRDSSHTDTAKANIETSGVVSEIYFKSSDTNKVTVSPLNASSSPQTVTFTGVSRMTPSPTVLAKAGSIDGFTADLINVAVYKQVAETKTKVKLIYVIEDNDDVQEIEPGESGSSTTDICVSPGDNGKRDTLKGNDDVYSGENILVGANLKCDSTANQTDVCPNTSLITAGDLQTYLNETIFNQCVADTFRVESNGSVECNYDLNLDGMLHYFEIGGSSEAQKIIDCAEDLNYNYNVFVVNKIDSGMTGFSKKYQRFAFVDTWGTTATALKSVIAHELGHAFGGLSDITISGQDDENLMSHYRDYTEGFRLRVLQWHLIQVFHNPP